MAKIRLLFSLAVIGCAFAGVGHFVESVASAEKAPREIEIEAKRFAFVPEKITLTKGEPVTLKLSSSDVEHSLYVRDLKINETIEPGQVTTITFVPENEGTYHGSCQLFCGEEHARMKLTIVVE